MSWLERRVLGGQSTQPAPPPPPPAPPPRADYGLTPRGMDAYPSSAPPAVPQGPLGPAWQPVPDPSSATRVAEILPIWQWQGNPRGGAKDTAELGNCPACRSPRYFSRIGSDGAGRVTRSDGVQMAPAPECFDCGYPRDQGTLGMATSTGPALPARQAESAAPSGSIAHLRH